MPPHVWYLIRQDGGEHDIDVAAHDDGSLDGVQQVGQGGLYCLQQQVVPANPQDFSHMALCPPNLQSRHLCKRPTRVLVLFGKTIGPGDL